MASGDVPRPVHQGWPALAAASAVFLLAAVLLLLTGGAEVALAAPSSSAMAPWALVPSAVGLALVRAVPWQVPGTVERRAHRALRGRPLGLESVCLLACLGVFAAFSLASGPSWQVIEPGSWVVPGAKLVLLLLIPLAMFRILRPGWRRDAPRLLRLATRAEDAWRWAGLLGAAAFIGLALPAPWPSPPPVLDGPAPTPITVATLLLTLLTGVLLGEVFFRVWLQTRLEILYGRWAGILLAALAFAVVQVALRPETEGMIITAASGILVYGGVGIFLGYMWARYRNIWPVLIAHGSLVVLPGLPGLATG